MPPKPPLGKWGGDKPLILGLKRISLKRAQNEISAFFDPDLRQNRDFVAE